MQLKYIGFVWIGIVATAQAQLKPVAASYPAAVSVAPVPVVGTDNLPFSMQAAYAPKRPMLTEQEVMNSGNRREEINKSFEYYDGLGRVVQNVQWQSSPRVGGVAYDMVAPATFDGFDRRVRNYLSYPASDTSGFVKFDAFAAQNTYWSAALPGESTFYQTTEYESSPLGRVTATAKYGNSWAGSGRAVRTSYELNTVSDSVRQLYVNDATGGIYTGTTFPAGRLYKNTTMDEDSNRTITFSNFNGEVLLRAVQHTRGLAGWQGYMLTYYVYNDGGKLCWVIQPEGVKQLQASNWAINYTTWNNSAVAQTQCFRYGYAQGGHAVLTLVPGAGLTESVYDQNDNLRMVRDSALKATGKWKLYSYDALNRVTSIELYTISATRAQLAAAFDADVDFSPATMGTYAATLREYQYDDYRYKIGQENDEAMDFDSTQTAGFFTPSDNVQPYARTCRPTDFVRGKLTHTVDYLPTSESESVVYYYDAENRPLQKITYGLLRGAEMITSQYDFQGNNIAVRSSLRSYVFAQMNTTVLLRNYYDHASRLIKQVNKVGDGAEVLIDSCAYDAIGRLVYKQIGQKKENGVYVSGAVDSLRMEYSVNNWLSAINRNFATGASNTGYFGEVISFDYGYTKNYYNGNVAGVSWRSKSDTIQRSYGFAYDASNRLLKADYTQKNAGAWSQTTLNFSSQLGNGTDATSAYDNNGNIQQLRNYGWAGNASVVIDDLRYGYESGANHLANVADSAAATANFKLGDFQDSAALINDYAYDGNGNLVRDVNKGITGITYNTTNKPVKVNLKGVGEVSYVYNADDIKLQKTVIDSTAGNKATTTYYYTDMVFEKVGNDSGRLAYIQHAQARVRPVTGGYTYDYFISDHLGNCRVVLNEAVQTYIYPACTLEGSVSDTNTAISVENNYYGIDTNNVVNQPSGFFAHTNNNGFTNPNPKGNPTAASQKVYKLNGTTTGKKGLDFVAKVMAGDSINVYAYSYYTTKTPTKNYLPPLSILTGLLGGVTGLGGVHGITASDLLSANTAALTSYVTTRPASDSVPAAYVNILWFDDQLKFVKATCSIVSVPSGGKTHSNDASTMLNQVANKSGYVYVFVSNESPTDVYFDNMQVVHKRGRLLEEYHYYPGGLTIAAISNKVLNAQYAENKYRFNKSSEFQNKEFSNGRGLEMYDTRFRQLDVQLGGRWWQVDPKPDFSESPYAAMKNNPILYNDPLGDTIRIHFGTGFLGLGKRKEVNYENGNITNTDGTAYSGKVKGFLKRAVGGLDQLRTGTNGNKLVTDIQSNTKVVNVMRGSNTFDEKDKETGMTNVVRWDPSNEMGGPDAALGQSRPAFVGLGHELAHAWDKVYDGSIDYAIWYNPTLTDKPVRMAEIFSTHIENLIRAEHGINLRAFYGIGENAAGMQVGEGAILTPGTRQNANTINANSLNLVNPTY